MMLNRALNLALNLALARALIKRNMPDRIFESQADYEFEQEQGQD